MSQFVGEVRDYLRDYPELNRLIVGEETSNKQIEYAVNLALDEWNSTPPPIKHTLSNFPSRTILLMLTLIYILHSAGMKKSRDHLPFNDGGFVVPAEEQTTLYSNWISMLRNQVNPLIARLKVALNIEGSGEAAAASEYSMIDIGGFTE